MNVISVPAKDKLFNATCLIIGFIMLYRGLMDFFLWGDDPYRKLLGCAFFAGVIGIYLMYLRLRIGFWIFCVGDFAVGLIFIFVLEDVWHHHVWPHILYALLFVPFLRDMRPLDLQSNKGNWSDVRADTEKQKLVEANVRSADTTSGYAKRGQHPKHHGCAKATFHVRDDLPDELQVGIFQPGAVHNALIRFSSGHTTDDRKADAHGMAIKLFNVPGDKLTEGHEGECTIDFVLVDSETFFTGNPREYRIFNTLFLRAGRHAVLAPFVFLWMIVFYPELLKRIREFVGKRIGSPLEISYFSSTPFKFGSIVVKYVVRPRLIGALKNPVTQINGLGRVLVDTLAVTAVTFDFGIDMQVDASIQPVEDPTVRWSAAQNSRREWLGSIVVQAQDVGLNESIAEDLSFSPWHTIEAHRPVGWINEARAPVYLKMVTIRHKANGVSPVASSEVPTRNWPNEPCEDGA